MIVLNEISVKTEPNPDCGLVHAAFEQSLGPLFLARFANRRWVGRKIEVRPRENGLHRPHGGWCPGAEFRPITRSDGPDNAQLGGSFRLLAMPRDLFEPRS